LKLENLGLHTTYELHATDKATPIRKEKLHLYHTAPSNKNAFDVPANEILGPCRLLWLQNFSRRTSGLRRRDGSRRTGCGSGWVGCPSNG
ncbi:unnamed protein product, partial [Sphacelaria rigidula]